MTALSVCLFFEFIVPKEDIFEVIPNSQSDGIFCQETEEVDRINRRKLNVEISEKVSSKVNMEEGTEWPKKIKIKIKLDS